MSTEASISDELRSETMRTQIMVGHALCAIAESEAYGGMADRALQNLITVRHILEEVSVYASDASGLPDDAARELLEFVREVQDRARNMDTMLQLLKNSA